MQPPAWVVIIPPRSGSKFAFCPAFAPIARHHRHDPAVDALADSG
jgi:hypothetical protein